jgi:uncharacterized protein YbjT (DUF2867 family)
MVDAVTGAFGYTGRYITARLLEAWQSVRTLTGHPTRPNPFGDRIEVVPFDFEDRRKLTEHLRGTKTLYNTYWVRFPHGEVTFDRAVANSETLVQAASEAGVDRVVHLSITNPSEDSPFPYFRGKARVEEIIRESGLGYTLVRPTGDLRGGRHPHQQHRLHPAQGPVFGIPGSGFVPAPTGRGRGRGRDLRPVGGL